MLDYKNQVLIEMKRAYSNPSERVWLSQEVIELGLKYDGLDALCSDCILDMAQIWASGSALPYTDYIERLSEYNLVKEEPVSGDYILSDKGQLAINSVVKQFIERQLFESNQTKSHFENLKTKLPNM